MPLRFSHVQSSWPWSIYSFNWGRLHLKHWEKGGSIQILPFSGQFSNGTRLMPCFLSISHRRREVWQRMRCIPAGSVTSLPGEQKPRGFPRGKNHKTSAEQVHSPWWAPHHRTCASQAIRRGPAGYTACSPPPAEDDAGSTVPAQGRRGGRLPETSGDQVKQLRRRRSRLRK